jgi:glycosyltransferase involved in cell wall biosynthesis
VIVLDVSRLLARASRATPTGIDRVELAYAQHLIASARPACFARARRWGGPALLPRPAVERYVGALALLWREGSSVRRRAQVRWAMLRLRLGGLRRRQRALAVQMRGQADQPVYLLVSHRHLEKRRMVAKLKSRHAMSFACLIHDLIPIEFPEYARPGQDKRHRRRIDTAAALADAVIVPSAATGTALQAYVERAGRTIPVLIAPFGVDLAPADGKGSLPDRSYFVCLGTIEPRKNHLLLLNLWRDLVAERGDKTPTLVLIGRRGWEIENTVDMLDRCPALRGILSERSELSDRDTVWLLRNAQALLLPSFAEGFGFPLVEALASGTPVLASDIPALREIGGGVPEYLDPLDGAAWRAAISEYSLAPSARREAQLQRLAHWQQPRWADHFAAIETLVAGLAADARSR